MNVEDMGLWLVQLYKRIIADIQFYDFIEYLLAEMAK